MINQNESDFCEVIFLGWNCFSSYCTKASMSFEGDQLATPANVLRVCFDSGPTVQVSWVVSHGSSTVSKALLEKEIGISTKLLSSAGK